jgi:DNA-binding CsgD family transcriptional regulator
MSISAKTVEANLSRAYQKLGVHNRAGLAAWAARGAEESGVSHG